VIIKGAHVLEASRAIDVLVLDKTGTLTTGSMTLVAIEPADVASDVLVAACALESRSEHPIARAIVRGLRDRGIATDDVSVESFVNQPGVGVSGTVSGRSVVIRRSAVDVESGDTVVEALVNGGSKVRLTVRDLPKPEARDVVSALRAMNVRPMIVSGDARGVVHSVARRVGIDPADTRAEVLPADKLKVIEELRASGHRVGMVGDGVNDAPALVASDLGIAMGTGTDAAMEAGDLTIVSGDLRLVPTALALSRRTLRTIRANLFWAFAYNVAALPLAVAGLMNPVLAGLAMALSSAFVVMNSLRLRR
jgi:Cu+-exporting ATPase